MRRPRVGELLGEAERHDGAMRLAPDYMCPNCVTPWKCNGPHIAAPVADERKENRWPAV